MIFPRKKKKVIALLMDNFFGEKSTYPLKLPLNLQCLPQIFD
jgi:hypothetical protein